MGICVTADGWRELHRLQKKIQLKRSIISNCIVNWNYHAGKGKKGSRKAGWGWGRVTRNSSGLLCSLHHAHAGFHMWSSILTSFPSVLQPLWPAESALGSLEHPSSFPAPEEETEIPSVITGLHLPSQSCSTHQGSEPKIHLRELYLPTEDRC